MSIVNKEILLIIILSQFHNFNLNKILCNSEINYV